ncbi:methyltransferase domain-containing protein [Streptomyces sp. ISL-10]|uniref:methyltransferase domain-containing protein n=1 Tax=Streptomyces sp. ISL-10 TaxID=2819172 RepID=UPI001BE85835|nr:methyltransferase domain-containing protein [Streptomyces sp. ISL-10]MBT2365575.1 methyltransferase domain-containing protein [Streptomyces sp. ISL-10]
MPIRESHLVQALEPFRGYVLSTMIFALQQSGLQDDLTEGRTVDQLVSEHKLDRARLTAMADYWVAAGLLDRSETGVLTLTDLARRYEEARPWYEMMVGGYGGTFLALGDHLAEGTGPAPRRGGYVGSGSCGISMHDSLPLLRKLLARDGRSYRRLVDLGCGSGVYLTELCRDYPEMTAVGIEPDVDGAAAARAWVAAQPTADRVTIEHTDALDWIGNTSEKPDLAVLAFVIHEVLGQEGEAGVRRLLTQLFTESPELTLAIVDIDLKHSDREAMAQPLAQAYYNAYLLMHPFTSQRLETKEWWNKLFAECGLRVEAFDTTDPSMDSTGFAVGWLLRKARR